MFDLLIVALVLWLLMRPRATAPASNVQVNEPATVEVTGDPGNQQLTTSTSDGTAIVRQPPVNPVVLPVDTSQGAPGASVVSIPMDTEVAPLLPAPSLSPDTVTLISPPPAIVASVPMDTPLPPPPIAAVASIPQSASVVNLPTPAIESVIDVPAPPPLITSGDIVMRELGGSGTLVPTFKGKVVDPDSNPDLFPAVLPAPPVPNSVPSDFIQMDTPPAPLVPTPYIDPVVLPSISMEPPPPAPPVPQSVSVQNLPTPAIESVINVPAPPPVITSGDVVMSPVGVSGDLLPTFKGKVVAPEDLPADLFPPAPPLPAFVPPPLSPPPPPVFVAPVPVAPAPVYVAPAPPPVDTYKGKVTAPEDLPDVASVSVEPPPPPVPTPIYLNDIQPLDPVSSAPLPFSAPVASEPVVIGGGRGYAAMPTPTSTVESVTVDDSSYSDISDLTPSQLGKLDAFA